METIILVLMVLVLLNTWIKLTFLKRWQMWAMALACACFVGGSYGMAIQQSRNEIRSWLADQPLMLDVSVVLTLEVFWQIAYCMLSARMLYGEPMRRRTICIYRVLRFFPGVLIFPVLYYMLIQVIYALPGYGFGSIAWTFAIAVGLALPMGAWVLHRSLPEKSLRLEVLFLLSSLTLILGIVATVNGTTTFHGSDPVEWMALLVFLLITLLCSIVGLIRYCNTNK